MEPDRISYFGQCFLVGFAFCNHDAFSAQGVCDITPGMPFYDDF